MWYQYNLHRNEETSRIKFRILGYFIIYIIVLQLPRRFISNYTELKRVTQQEDWAAIALTVLTSSISYAFSLTHQSRTSFNHFFRPTSQHQPVIKFDTNLFLELSPKGKAYLCCIYTYKAEFLCVCVSVPLSLRNYQ